MTYRRGSSRALIPVGHAASTLHPPPSLAQREKIARSACSRASDENRAVLLVFLLPRNRIARTIAPSSCVPPPREDPMRSANLFRVPRTLAPYESARSFTRAADRSFARLAIRVHQFTGERPAERPHVGAYDYTYELRLLSTRFAVYNRRLYLIVRYFYSVTMTDRRFLPPKATCDALGGLALPASFALLLFFCLFVCLFFFLFFFSLFFLFQFSFFFLFFLVTPLRVTLIAFAAARSSADPISERIRTRARAHVKR